MINPIITRANEILNSILDSLEQSLSADILCINGPINSELVTMSREAIETRYNSYGLRNKLCVMLTTNGGDVTSTERLVTIFRHYYNEVEFIVPDYAYSAGTILCMSGDRIWMNYNSVLGPIDPQVLNKENRYVPAMGYLEKIKELLKKAKKNTISQAEFLILKDFDLAEISQYEQATDLTIELLNKWLVKYKFKNWDIHSSNGTIVTKEEKEQRAKKIAKELGNYKRWKSHGRPLTIETLNSLKLLIDDFDQCSFGKEIVEFHNILVDYMSLQNANAMIYMRSTQ